MINVTPTPGAAGVGQFLLRCRTPAGDTDVHLFYTPKTSELVDSEGVHLLRDRRPDTFSPALAVSHAHPGRKSHSPARLKIQLGLGCNYSCSYCNQASETGSASLTSRTDAEEFVAGLDQWLWQAPEQIEFWGGEPLLYFHKMQLMVPELRRRYPAARFTVVTNGSLLDQVIVDFLDQYDFYVSVSHDGPGQALRGPDPFDDPFKAHWLQELWRRRGGPHGKVSFHVVLTAKSANLRRTREWLAARMNDPNLAVDVEGVVNVYDDVAAQTGARWETADYAEMQRSIVEGFVDGSAFEIKMLRDKAIDLIESLQAARPSSALSQKCGMDQSENLAVDLHGNVMTCQNTGALGKHRIGHVHDLDAVRLDTATHWTHRQTCTKCPVVQLCQGSCMFLGGDLFDQSCENEFQFNLAILAGTIESVTGLKVVEVVGDMVRPNLRKRIPLKSVGM